MKDSGSNNFIPINNICYEGYLQQELLLRLPDCRILHTSYLSILTHRFHLE